MSDKLDMSLEDIIKLNKGSVNFRGGVGGVGRRNSAYREGGEFRNRRGGYGINRGTNFGVSRGGVQYRRENRPSTFTRQNELPEQWRHDLFETLDRPAAAKQSYGSLDSGKGSSTLLISNLHFGVNDTDMKELFGEFGELTKAAVHYDKSGRSLGTAEIIFEHHADAFKALKQYNNVPLDGQTMKITLLNDVSQSRNVSSRIGPIPIRDNHNEDGGRPQRRQNSGSRQPWRGGRSRPSRYGSSRGNRGGGRNERDKTTKEDLDAELDAYNAKMETD